MSAGLDLGPRVEEEEMTRQRVLGLAAAAALAGGMALWTAACSKAEEPPAAPAAGDMVLTSPAFEDGGDIPADYTRNGRNVSPPLAWDKAPDGAVTFALIVDDPDAPLGPFVHWLICEMPATTRALPEGVPKGENVSRPVVAVQGVNGFRETGYGGPRPPKGERHRYVFRLYALDEELSMSGGFNKKQLEEAIKGHVLAEARLMGRYAQ